MISTSCLVIWPATVAILFANAPLGLAQDDLRITEFMASNTKTLQDEDHTYPDWIEIFNAGAQTVSLLNWSLTDNANNLTKWRFPATNIAAGAFMVIFADGKNRAVPGAPLHTSFSLSAGGEYLALVKPDGTNIVTEFRQINNGFPPQAPDVSYGFGPLTTALTVISSNSAVTWRIPNGTEGAGWTGTNYDDSAWALGTNGVGFGSFASANYAQAVLPTAPVVYYRLNESSGTTAANIGSATASDGAYNAVTLGTAGPRPASGFNGFEANNNAPTFNGTSSYVGGPSQLLSGRSAFTIAGWVNFGAAPIARTGLFGQNDAVEFGFSAVGTIQCFTAGGGSATLAYTPPLNTWVHILAVGDGTTVRIFINGALLGSGGSATANYGSSTFNFNIGGGGVFDATGNFFTGLMDEVVVYQRALSTTEILGLYQAGTNGVGSASSSLVRTDVSTAMSNVNASAYIRIPFVVTNATNVSLISLRMQYNDGFVASINGIEAVRVNAPDALGFNSSATNMHASITAEEFRLGTGTLADGTNILAIQGLNVAANDTNFFISAEMVLTIVQGDSPTPVFFTVPTPGAANLGGIANPGPAILNASNYPVVPLDSQDLTVSAKVVPTFYAVSNVVLRYRIMFGNTNEVPMFDDGLHGDGAAGDGVFGAIIPESASTNGQMIRWYFVATDTHGNTSRWPLFNDPAQTAEYLGTIVDPTNITSKLPIYHIFAPTTVLSPGPTTAQTGADSQTGGHVSLFYDGEFYDNIQMNLRGNSTAGFNKKAHHVNFNTEHPFRHTGPGGRIRHTSFTAEYPDPSYMRQFLSFWLAGRMGAPQPFYYPVRLQLNGQFYQLASHNDVVGAEQLQRFGFDPEGALYKAYGTVVFPIDSTGAPEKKTRVTENNSDYIALATGIAETNSIGTRRTNVFDLLDIPEVLDYLVTARWSHENDDVWANMTLYRDTLGDRLWRIIPFDMNLSWGAIFYEGTANGCTPYVEGVQATNDVHKAHPLYGSSQTLACNASASRYNRMYDTFFQVPEFRQMFLRRMRTLMDTWIKPIGTPTNSNSTALEQLILARRDLIAEEVVNDRLKWGWPPKGGQCNFDPGIDLTNGVSQLINQFIYVRRAHFYVKHSITNTALPIGISSASNAGIPLSQAPDATITVLGVEANPASANQAEEYICLTNSAPSAVDISGWTLSGAVDFTFKPGTVMIPNSILYVSPDVNAFRARPTSPHGGQGLFVVGPYQGQLSARGEVIRITDDSGRLVSTNSYPGNPSLAQQFLRITELMYHPAPLAGNANAADEFEYIELKNIGPTLTLDLTGVHFVNGVDFAFTGSAITNLGPGEKVLVVKNPTAFSARYGALTNIAGTYAGNLDNGGERIQLLDANNEEILDFSYNNSWYPLTDGLGFSLVIVDEQAAPETWDSKANWRASGQIDGTPGTVDPGALQFSTILINEILTHTTPPQYDAIELYNPNATNVDLSGWFLTDNLSIPKKYRIPNGTSITATGYLVFYADTSFGGVFNLSSKGEEVYLLSGDANTNLTGYVHGFTFGAQAEGVTFGRYITSTGDEHFPAQTTPSLGFANVGPKVGPIVISKINYHPPDIATDYGPQNNEQDEFIELQNITGVDQPLFDPSFPTNTWHLRNGLDYTFPTNITIPAGGHVLVVSFDPASPSASARFRAANPVASGTPLFGPFHGQLNNGGESLELARPDVPEPADALEPFAVYYILVDKVSYSNESPWPLIGLGYFLQRLPLTGYGNDPVNWVVPVSISAHPQGRNLRLDGPTSTASLTLNVAVGSGSEPITYQWLYNGAPIPGANNPVLSLSNVSIYQTGDYSVVVGNAYNSTTSSVARLNIYTDVGWRFASMTGDFNNGTNVDIYMQAAGDVYIDDVSLVPASGPYAGINVVTNGDFESPLTVGPWLIPASMSNSARTNSIAHSGSFSLHVVAASAGNIILGTVIKHPLPPVGSNVCTLSFWYHTIDSTNFFIRTFPGSSINNVNGFSPKPTDAPPGIASQPNNLALPVAATASFGVTAYGSEPFFYQWFKDGNPLADGGKITGATAATLLISPIQAGEIGNYSVKVSNALGFTNSTTASLSVTGAPPEITLQPQSQNVPCNGSVTFTVAAIGSAPLSYQWRSNLTAILDATNISLTLTNLTPSANGAYSVVVSNPAGSTNSADANLVVTDPLASLGVQRNGTNLVVTWPVTCTVYQLEETATLSPASWAPPATATIQQTQSVWTATIPIAEGNKFYRLRN